MSGDINEFIKILQISISPVVLISGVGLLVLSLVNRFAHILDRVRKLSREKAEPGQEQERYLREQVRILYMRSWIVLIAICLALGCVLFASILIATLFITYMLGAGYVLLIASLFIISISCLVASIILYMFDMSLSLKALRIDINKLLGN